MDWNQTQTLSYQDMCKFFVNLSKQLGELFAQSTELFVLHLTDEEWVVKKGLIFCYIVRKEGIFAKLKGLPILYNIDNIYMTESGAIQESCLRNTGSYSDIHGAAGRQIIPDFLYPQNISAFKI